MATSKTQKTASVLPAFVPVVPRCLAVLRLTAYMCDNKYSLLVSLKEDGTLSYGLFGGWGHTGISHSIDMVLPLNGRTFASTEALAAAIRLVVRQKYQSIDSTELLNQIF